jgi:mannose-6-phosphate isomerase-like protein (cupin superfamily)
MGASSDVEIHSSLTFTTLSNPGVTSIQMLWPQNSPSACVTITKVTVAIGAGQPRHSHENSEQIWIAESGSATLLLANGQSRPIQAGDIVRTPSACVHGVQNDGDEPFVYLSITTPPIDFTAAYRSSEP